MACDICWAMPQRKLKKHSFLVIMVDSVTNQEGQCVVQSECAHGMQEWMEFLASKASLSVVDPRDPHVSFSMSNPIVTHIDAKVASHIPLREPDLTN